MKLSRAISDFQAYLSGGKHSPLTREMYLYLLERLIAFIGDKPLEEITPSDLWRWQAGKHRLVEAGKLSIWSLHQYTRQLRTFFSWCVKHDYLITSPADRLELPKLPKGQPPKNISDTDLARMLQIASLSSPRDLAIVCLLADTGCRVSGLANLLWGNLDFRRQSMVVTEKGLQTRIAFFGLDTASAIRALWEIQGQPPDDAPVFLGRRGPPLTRFGIYQLLKRLAKRGGIEGRCNPHAFRHAWARRALELGMDLGTVSRILGHSNLEVTHQFYACWDQKELKDRHRKYNTLAKFRVTTQAF